MFFAGSAFFGDVVGPSAGGTFVMASASFIIIAGE
jgi:hypothetical protein